MRTFEYRGFDRAGGTRRGLIEGADVKEARERLAARGILAERLVPAGSRVRGLFRGGADLPAELRVVFYRELAVLLDAGLPLVAALEILIQSPEFGRGTVLLAGVRDRVREGAGLAAALATAGARPAPHERAIVEVGEKAGNLAEVLEKLAAFLEEQHRLRERIVSALIYPTIIFVFAVCVAVVMLGFVIPSAAQLLVREARVELPWLTRAMITVGRALVWGVPLVLAAAVGGVLAGRRAAARETAVRQRMDRLWFRLPLIGRGYALVVNLRWARTLAMLLRGGVPLLEALPLAGRATGSAWVTAQMEKETEAVRHGSSLADAVRRVPVLAASLPAWIQAGEASGALERLLDTAADSYQHRWNRFATRALSVLEPALIALLGVFVLLVVLSVLLPIVAMNRALG